MPDSVRVFGAGAGDVIVVVVFVGEEGVCVDVGWWWWWMLESLSPTRRWVRRLVLGWADGRFWMAGWRGVCKEDSMCVELREVGWACVFGGFELGGAASGHSEVRWSWGGVGEAQFNVGLGIACHVGSRY